MTDKYKKEIKIVLFLFVLKIVILTLLPLTGDEAYFIKWGENLSSGYYDHPPMVGWLIYLMGFINHSYILFRFFAVITTLVAAFVIYKIALLFKTDKDKSFLLAAVFLVSPIDLFILLFTNDVPLLLFGSLGALFLLYSFEKAQWLKYTILSGIFLGLAFLSKYFAVFLMFGLLIYLFKNYGKKAIRNVLITAFVVSLFILQNLYFNYNSCWNNIMFNFFARTQSNSYNLSTLIGFFTLIFYLMTPWGVYYLYKSKKSFKNNNLIKFIAPILLVAFTVFLIVSLKNKIGLHWFILFLPYIFLLFSVLDEKELIKLFNYTSIFTFLHVILLLTALFVPKSFFENNKQYTNILLFTKTDTVCNGIDKYNDGPIFAFGYTTASILSYHCKRDVKMLFNTSKYGRFDDKLLDVRELNNKNIYLFDKSIIETDDFKNICESVDIEKLNIENANFHMAKCNNFNYEQYKFEYLDVQKEKFYNIPSWLPVGECYFSQRYYNR